MIVTEDTQSRYTPNCGVVPPGATVTCGVCQAMMLEERNVVGPRSSTEAISGNSSTFDSFHCPHLKEVWHRQVIALRRAVRNTPSQQIADIMLAEVNLILSTKKATKEIFQ